MSETNEIVCFHCGQAVGDPPALNLLEDGETCPACRDRALEAVAAPLPSRPELVMEEQYTAEGPDLSTDGPA